MIRVLHFAEIINRFDIIDTVLTRLDRSRFEVFAMTGKPPREAGEYKSEEIYDTRCLNFEFTRSNFGRMFSALVGEIKRFRPHILQAHHYNENIVASLAVRFARVPCYIIGRHYSDHIYYLTRGLKRRAFLAAEGFCNKAATRITVPTKGVAQILTDLQGVPSEKVVVIPFGLDFNKYRPSTPEAPLRLRSEFGLEEKYMVIACGRLNPEKGLDYLLKAVPEVRSRNGDFRLVLVGSGPYEDHLRRLSRELNLEDTVQFVGWRNDPMDWIAAADLIVHPAFCESWCQLLFEALAFSKPVIMTPVGAAPEVIGDNERGRLIPPGDSQAMATAMIELMSDREKGRRMAEAGRDFIYRNVGADLATRRYEELYETALRQAS